MAFLENGSQPRVAGPFIQVRVVSPRCIILVCLLASSGCDYHRVGPEAWWHDAIGGKIAQERPPPPGDKDPYPNLATIPPKPPAADTAAWNRMTAGLLTDRIKANETAALAPIPPPLMGTQAPPPFTAGPTPPAQEGGASAALTAASPPPAPAGKASPAAAVPSPPAVAAPPAAAVAEKAPPAGNTSGQAPQAATSAAASSVPAASAPKAAPATSAAAAPGPAPGGNQLVATAQGGATGGAAAAGPRADTGPVPALPTQEPTRPNISPIAPPPAVPITAAPPAATPAPLNGTAIDFSRGSASLSDPALSDVKALAAARGDRGIAVTGHGDAASSDALGQSEALGLALRRAQAVATALVAQGVPYGFLRINAEAAGRGASLRLLQ